MSNVAVDRYDIDLLLALQRDGRTTNSALGEKIHLSTSQVSRRIQRLEESDIISHYAAVLNPDVVGLGVMAFTHVTLGSVDVSFERCVQTKACADKARGTAKGNPFASRATLYAHALV